MIAGGDSERIAATLTTLFAAYPAARMDQAAILSRARTYVEVLSDRPAWAVDRAAKRWLRGDAEAEPKALDFPPSAARLRQLATAEMSACFLEKGTLQKLRRARVIPQVTPQQRKARIAALKAAGLLTESEPPAAA